MNNKFFQNKFFFRWASVFMLVILNGCRTILLAPILATPEISDTPIASTNTTVNVPTPTKSHQTTASRLGTPFPIFSNTSTPTKTATMKSTPIPVVSGTVSKDLLMTIEEKLFFSIGILPAGETNPKVLLREPKHSFESPRWAHDGNWIAFRQTDYGIHVDHLGIIQKDGTGKRILAPEFGAISGPEWSADNKLLVTLVLTSSGLLPIAVNIETEEVVDLFPNPGVHFINSRFEVSPREMQAIFIGFIEGNPMSMELWLLGLDGRNQYKISVPSEVTMDCSDLPHPMEWSPDGKAILIQFYETSLVNCRPSLWLLNLGDESWSNVIQLPEKPPTHLNPDLFYQGWELIFWSPDGFWVSWLKRSSCSIYSTNDWKLVREIDLQKGVDANILVRPWVEDNNGNSIFSIYRNYSITGLTNTVVDIWGLSPNGTESNDVILVHIEADEPNWLPKGSFLPYMWQP